MKARKVLSLILGIGIMIVSLGVTATANNDNGADTAKNAGNPGCTVNLPSAGIDSTYTEHVHHRWKGDNVWLMCHFSDLNYSDTYDGTKTYTEEANCTIAAKEQTPSSGKWPKDSSPAFPKIEDADIFFRTNGNGQGVLRCSGSI